MSSWYIFPRDRPGRGHQRDSDNSYLELIGDGDSTLDEHSSLPSENALCPNKIRRLLATSLAPTLAHSSRLQDDDADDTIGTQSSRQDEMDFDSSKITPFTSYLDTETNPFSDSAYNADSTSRSSPLSAGPPTRSVITEQGYFGLTNNGRPPSDSESRCSESMYERRPSSFYDAEKQPLLPESPHKPLSSNSVSRATEPETSSTYAVSISSATRTPAHNQVISLLGSGTPPLRSLRTSVSTTLPTTPTPSLSHTASTASSPHSSYSTSTAYSINSVSPTTVTPDSPLSNTRFSIDSTKAKQRDAPVGDAIRYHDLMISYHHRRATSSIDSSIAISDDHKLIPPATDIGNHEPPGRARAKTSACSGRALKPSPDIQGPNFIFPSPDHQPAPSPSVSTRTATTTIYPSPMQTHPSTPPAQHSAAFPILFPLLSAHQSPNGHTSGFDWDDSPPSSAQNKVPFIKKVKSLGNLSRSNSRSRSRGRTRKRADSKRANMEPFPTSKGPTKTGAHSASPGVYGHYQKRCSSVSPTSIPPASPLNLSSPPSAGARPPLPPLPHLFLPTPPIRDSPTTFAFNTHSKLLQHQTSAAYPRTPKPTPSPTQATLPPCGPPASALNPTLTAVASGALPSQQKKPRKLAKPPANAPVLSTSVDAPLMTPATVAVERGGEVGDVSGIRGGNGEVGGGAGLLRRCCRRMLGRGK
ncbi:MAG: hypothetical protein Q9160_003845 [Pyrenula sp. 1 TL-2023]